MGDKNEYVVIQVDNVIHETDEAILIEVDKEAQWLPKSQLEDWPRVGDSGEISVNLLQSSKP